MIIYSNKIELIDQFFNDFADLQIFRLTCSFRMKTTDDGICKAWLKKVSDRVWAYVLTYDGKMIGDYLKPLEGSQKALDEFNQGFEVIAQWMQIYLEVGDPDLVAEEEPAFGSRIYIPKVGEEYDMSVPSDL